MSTVVVGLKAQFRSRLRPTVEAAAEGGHEFVGSVNFATVAEAD